MDLAGWQPRLAELTRRHQVPGASLAVLADGEVTTLATGLLHTGTGVEATTDSLFQIGSMSKAYTATVVLALVDLGLAGVDTPVAEILMPGRASTGSAPGRSLPSPSRRDGETRR